MTRIITITSGTAGVGKTTITVNLAAHLSALGQRVCVLDADPGGNDVATLLGEHPALNLEGVLTGDANMDEACQPSDEGFDWVPGGQPGCELLTQLPARRLQRLADGFSSLDDYDFILIDTATSLHANVLGLALSGSELLLILDTETESLSESYALLKILFSEAYSGRINVVINKTKNHTVGRHSYNKFREVAGYYLSMELPLAGLIADDPLMLDTGTSGGSLLKQGTASQASRDIEALAHYLVTGYTDTTGMSVAEFSRRYLTATGLQVTNLVDDTLQQPSWRHDEEPAGLHDQLERLSDQVDNLIAEVDQLRRNEPPGAGDFPEHQQRDPEPDAEHCSAPCIAAMASFTETCSVHDDTFPVYQIEQPGGRMQRFALHSMDDDIQEPEHRTKSS